MPKRIPLSIGQKFGEWIVIGDEFKKSSLSGVFHVPVRCSCGNESLVLKAALKSKTSTCCKECSGKKRRSINVFPGKKFGSWTVVCELEAIVRSGKPVRRVLACCSCGTERSLELIGLVHGRSVCCLDCSNKLKTDHGMSKSREYQVWRHMLNRCFDPTSAGYANYGARGVTVCDRWNPDKGGSFQNFYLDLGPRPSADYQLDKEILHKDNMIYGPGLCGWATRRENIMRRRNTIYVKFYDKSTTLVDLAKEYDLDYYFLYYKIVLCGNSAEEVISSLSTNHRKRTS